MEQKLAAGDRVRSVAGGPVMTVETIAAGNACCVWFEGATRREAHLACATLVPVAAGDTPSEDAFQTGQ